MTSRPRSAAAGERGFALLIVLWTLALLALIGSHITASAHGMLVRAASLRAAAEAEAVADGLVEQEIFHLMDPSQRRWQADGIVRPVVVPGGSGLVVIEDNAGRINPGSASAPLMAALMRRVGMDQAGAERIAASLADWHKAGTPGGPGASPYRAAGLNWAPSNERFATDEEMALVLGMTPDILTRLAPYVSVHTDGTVNIARASPTVAGALLDAGADRPPPANDGGPLVVDITAKVTLHGARAVRHAVVRIDTNDDDAVRPYRFLVRD